jgi:hypothetical protein
MNSEKTTIAAPVHGIVIRRERGWAGHFICADRCQFRRNTLLERGSVRIVVSSVGLMTNHRDENKFQEVGLDRQHFETMAFHAAYDGRYWDADVTREVLFESPWMVREVEADDIANDQHDAVVSEIEQRIVNGEFDG